MSSFHFVCGLFYDPQRAQPEELAKIRKHYETSDEENVRLLDKPEQWETSKISNVITLNFNQEYHVSDYKTAWTVATCPIPQLILLTEEPAKASCHKLYVRCPDTFTISILNVSLQSQMFILWDQTLKFSTAL